MNSSVKIPLIFMLISSILRIAPHPDNFSPTIASIIYAGFSLSALFSIGATLVSILVSDFFLSLIYGYPFFGYTMLYIYPTYFLIGALSRLVIKKANQYIKVSLITIGSSVIFFLITNLGWYLQFNTIYSWMGLWNNYVDALPFVKNEILGTVLYTSLVFGYHNLLIKENEPALNNVDNADINNVGVVNYDANETMNSTPRDDMCKNLI